MSEEEKEAIKQFKNFIYTYQDVIEDEYSDCEEVESAKEYQEVSEKILNLLERRQKEIEEYKKFKKDIVNKIMIWDKEELSDNEAIISMLDTFKAEVSRLEDIEDKKVEVAVDCIEEKRDKFWKDKIREKLNYFENSFDYDDDGTSYELVMKVLEELLEENK